MSQHHLDELSNALTQKGWTIVSTRLLSDHPYDRNAWSLRRGSIEFEIQFDRFGGMGEDLPITETHGCSVGDSIHLYFGKRKRWNEELPAFLSKLDDLT